MSYRLSGEQLRICRCSLRRRTLFVGFACWLKRDQVWWQYRRPRFLHLLGNRCRGKSVGTHALTLCLRGVQDSALPRLELFVRQSKLSPWCAESTDYPKGTRRSITAVILCCFSESNISLAVAFKHLNNKLAFYICEAVECLGKHISRYS